MARAHRAPKEMLAGVPGWGPRADLQNNPVPRLCTAEAGPRPATHSLPQFPSPLRVHKEFSLVPDATIPTPNHRPGRSAPGAAELGSCGVAPGPRLPGVEWQGPCAGRREGPWPPAAARPGPGRQSAGTSQRFRANVRVAAGPTAQSRRPGRSRAGAGAASPLRLRRGRGAPAGSRAAAGVGGGVGNPGSGTAPGGRPGRGVASRKRALERSSRVSPSPRPRALRAPGRAPRTPCAPTTPRGRGAPGARCTCRAVQVAARALRSGRRPAPRSAPGGAGEAGRPGPI